MPTTITFTQPAEWQAMRAAEEMVRRLRHLGRSPPERRPGLMRGDYDIQKWRNLTMHNRAVLDGTMTAADFCHGPVTVRLSYDINPVPAGADQREGV